MNTVIELLRGHEQVSGYKINVHKKESYELFFVKGKLETVRATDTCDKEVTVYVQHGDCMGDSQFFIYPTSTPEQLHTLIDEAVEKALLIHNNTYTLPQAETGEFEVASNFRDYTPAELAELISGTVFAANTVENAALNSVEVFINKHTETVCNSLGLHKTQVRYDAMVEAIPTYNGAEQSVELYEQYNFGSLEPEALKQEIALRMAEVKARYEASTPASPLSGNVILNIQEVALLLMNIAGDLHYSTVYSHSNLFKKGDLIQKAPTGDKLGLTMSGEAPGSTRSAKFDADGLSLGSIRLVDGGRVMNYYGNNRFGQYLGEIPTGTLRCMLAEPGTAEPGDFQAGPCLEIVSMSGLQVDFYSDYIGGEVRLAYYCDGGKTVPVTGVSVSGKLSEVLESIRFSRETGVYNGYCGPSKAILQNMNIF